MWGAHCLFWGIDMADLSRIKSNRLHDEAWRSRKAVLLYGLPVVVGLCLFYHDLWWWFCAAYLILALNAGAVKRAGAKGEDAALALLSRLPGDHVVLNQVCTPGKNGRRCETDFVVVSPQAIFTIEVKSNNGEIAGSANSKEWDILKIGQGGTPYTKTMRNPLRQAYGQSLSVRDYLKSRDLRAWVQPVVYFSNPDSVLRATGDERVPLFHAARPYDLLNFIEEFRSRRIINDPQLIADEFV